jgi:mRNA interferase RelE/StbE
MAAYRLKLHKDAVRFLRRLPAPRRHQVRARLDLLALDPRDATRLDVRPLRGEPGLWRLRVGKIRAIYEIQDDRLVVYVLIIGNRGDVYKRGT